MTDKPKNKPPIRTTMPRTVMMRDRASTIGVSVATLAHWENDGCDITNDESVRAHLSKLSRLPKGLNEEWKPKSESLDETPDIAFLKEQLLRTLDERDARRIKTQIDGLLSAQKLEVLNGSYISVIEERDAWIKLGAVLKTCVDRLSADLPPVLEGLDPSTMSKRIRQIGDKMLAELADGKGDFWK